MIRRSRLLLFFLFLLVIASLLQKTNQIADKDISAGIDRVISGNRRMANKFPIKFGAGGRGGGGGRGGYGGGHGGYGGRGGHAGRGGGLIGHGGSGDRGGGSTDGGYRSSTEGGIPCKTAGCGGGSYFPRHKSGGNSRRSCGGVAAVIAAAMFSSWVM